MPYFKSGGLNIYYREKGVEKKHSETAIYTALLRAIDNKEFGSEKFGPDYLAQYFLPPHLWNINGQNHRNFSLFNGV
jgi:hypothetical protein